MIDTTYVSAQTIHDIQSASSTLGLKDWLSLIALFLSAIVAVLIGQYLQDRKSKKDRDYQNKFAVFAAILGLRHAKASNEQFVISLNQIPIVFHGNKEILIKLDRFIKSHADQVSTIDKIIENMNSDLNDLVLEMAKDLGYSNIDNNVMKTFYHPDASFYRYQCDAVYNELYCLEKYPQLVSARGEGEKKPKDQQVHQQEN